MKLSRRLALSSVLFSHLTLAFACAGSLDPASAAHAELLKNWALSRCLAKSDASDSQRADAAQSAAAYLEQSTAGIETFERLERLVDGCLAKRTSGSVPGNYDTMKCIELFRSAELQQLAEREARAAPVTPTTPAHPPHTP